MHEHVDYARDRSGIAGRGLPSGGLYPDHGGDVDLGQPGEFPLFELEQGAAGLHLRQLRSSRLGGSLAPIHAARLKPRFDRPGHSSRCQTTSTVPRGNCGLSVRSVLNQLQSWAALGTGLQCDLEAGGKLNAAPHVVQRLGAD
jgi:hypothetical protein